MNLGELPAVCGKTCLYFQLERHVYLITESSIVTSSIPLQKYMRYVIITRRKPLLFSILRSPMLRFSAHFLDNLEYKTLPYRYGLWFVHVMSMQKWRLLWRGSFLFPCISQRLPFDATNATMIRSWIKQSVEQPSRVAQLRSHFALFIWRSDKMARKLWRKVVLPGKFANKTIVNTSLNLLVESHVKLSAVKKICATGTVFKVTSALWSKSVGILAGFG